MFENLPDRVSVYEVSPRDGLQNERATVPLRSKVRLIEALAMAGLARIEITSFVSPTWIPQLADGDEVARYAKPAAGVSYSALCPNAKGLARARAAGMREIAVFVSASETHNRKNVNKTVAETLAAFEETIGPALAEGMRVRGYVSTVWGCPFEGEVDPERAVAIARKLVEMGCYQISSGATDDRGRHSASDGSHSRADARRARAASHRDAHARHPRDRARQRAGRPRAGRARLRRQRRGLGGCPEARSAAAGNLATEDLVFMLHGMGVETGIHLERLVEAGKVAESVVGRTLPGKVHLAGVSAQGSEGLGRGSGLRSGVKPQMPTRKIEADRK